MKLRGILSFCIVLLLGLSAAAQDRQLLRRATEEVRIAQDQVRTVIRQSTDEASKERLRYAQDKLYSTEQYIQRFLEQGGGGSNPPPYGESVGLYRSDSCNGELIATYRDSSNCGAFATASIWGIKIGNTCHNILDMSGAEFCQSFSTIQNPRAVLFYRNDSCSSELVGAADRYTSCSSLPNKPVWGVKINGTCQDINDTNLPTACERFAQ